MAIELLKKIVVILLLQSFVTGCDELKYEHVETFHLGEIEYEVSKLSILDDGLKDLTSRCDIDLWMNDYITPKEDNSSAGRLYVFTSKVDSGAVDLIMHEISNIF